LAKMGMKDTGVRLITLIMFGATRYTVNADKALVLALECETATC
jgi:hypothetical protein